MVAPSQSGPKVRPKKKIVVDLLVLCIENSRLVEKLSVDTVRYVVESALGEIYREGEFRLEPLWAILRKEPGIDMEMSAAPLLAFKALDEQTNLRVRLPADVIGLAPLQASELRKTVKLPAEKLDPLLEELRAADVNSAADVEARQARASLTGSQSAIGGARPGAKPQSKARLLGLLAGLAVAVAVAAFLLLKK